MVTESSANVLLFADSGWLVSFFRRVKPPPLSRLSLLSFLVACQPANCTWPRLRGHIQRPGSSSIAMDNTHHIITATSNVGSTLRLPCFHHPGVSAVGRLMVGMASACDDRSSQHPVRAAELNMPRNCPRMRVGGTIPRCDEKLCLCDALPIRAHSGIRWYSAASKLAVGQCRSRCAASTEFCRSRLTPTPARRHKD
jgi:hypothetical protein